MSLPARSQPWNDTPVLGPIGVAITTLSTVASSVLGFDAVRHGVLFHNPGTKTKRVAPAGVSLAGGSGGMPIFGGSSWMLLQDENSDYQVNCEWQAVTDDNADAALTILNFTDANPAVTTAPMPTIRQNQVISVTSPVDTATALATSSIPILSADPNRRGVIFINASLVDIAVCPSNLVAIVGAGSIVVPAGGEARILGNRRVKINCAWNGISASGSGNQLTALGLYG
jgi:hypothetical protein